MRIRFGVAGIITAGITVAAVSLASAASNGAAGEQHGTRVIKVFEQTVQNEFVNVGAEGFSLGDEVVFSSDLLRRKGGATVGSDGGACVAARVVGENSGVFQCSVTARLAGGQITTQGLVEFAEGETPPPFEIAITGGTGAYEGARGHLRVKELSETESELTFYLRARQD